MAWTERRAKTVHQWAVPFVWIEHGMDWLAYLLSHWSFLEVLAYLESLGVLVAVIFYFAESGDRLKQKHYQAWQVINSAQGKGGNGGRIDALEVLNGDGVSLVGVDLSSAFLQGVKLPKADLSRADFSGADARDADLDHSNIEYATLKSANFRGANLRGADFQGSVLDDGDFVGATLARADLGGVSLENADLREAEFEGVKWTNLKCVKGANLYRVRNAPEGFISWAMAHGAINSAE